MQVVGGKINKMGKEGIICLSWPSAILKCTNNSKLHAFSQRMMAFKGLKIYRISMYLRIKLFYKSEDFQRPLDLRNICISW